MRKSEYEAMLMDDQGKLHDLDELDTSFKVLKALIEMDKTEKIQSESKKRRSNPILSWMIQKKRV